jgi:hypothetical protein
VTGHEILGHNWDENCASNKSSKQRAEAIRNLRNAFQSGQVTVVKVSPSDSKPLTTTDAMDEFLLIDPARDCIELSAVPGLEFQCRISTRELVGYLKKSRRPLVESKSSAESKCIKWLIEVFSNESIPPVDKVLSDEACKMFTGLSQKGYARAKLVAATQLGRNDLFRGGRPKGSLGKTKNRTTK